MEMQKAAQMENTMEMQKAVQMKNTMGSGKEPQTGDRKERKMARPKDAAMARRRVLE